MRRFLFIYYSNKRKYIMALLWKRQHGHTWIIHARAYIPTDRPTASPNGSFSSFLFLLSTNQTIQSSLAWNDQPQPQTLKAQHLSITERYTHMVMPRPFKQNNMWYRTDFSRNNPGRKTKSNTKKPHPQKNFNIYIFPQSRTSSIGRPFETKSIQSDSDYIKMKNWHQKTTTS